VDWQFDFKDGSRVLVSFNDEAGVASNGTGPVAGQDYALNRPEYAGGWLV
jgi:hypothetical protein